MNHTMAEMLAMIVNERQTTGTCSSLTSTPHTTIRSARRRVWCPTRFTWVDFDVSLSLKVFERTGVSGHQSLARDHLAYCDLATN